MKEENIMKDNGVTIKDVEKVNTNIKMAQYILEDGKTITEKEKQNLQIQMDLITKENIKRMREAGKV